MTQGYSLNCSDLTNKWDQKLNRCVPCSSPGPGRRTTPNCGWDDNGGRHEGSSSPCPQGTFNIGNSYQCTPCSACTKGYTSTPCTPHKDTECHKITTPAPPTVAPTLFHIPSATNQTITTSVTVTSHYPSTFITHTIPISTGTFWGLAAMFMLLKQPKVFETDPFHCGGDGGFSDNVIMIASNFNVSTNCTYAVIMTDNSTTIGVIFKQMDLSDNCNEEYVELLDGMEDKSLGKFCGKEIPPEVTTTSSTLIINFISIPPSRGSGGFIGHYYQIK
ncbi:hypothetical protein LDVICp101 [lymphocystis disease virus-China]|uniref:Tumor necrosis factor receptor-like protein n=2 Tax=Lymphocystis disease virus 2 TaxID=159183 RepID=A0A6F8X1M2_9VIRU|nr:hypothetical protein LDVICp101 [lymphocystis disease virus-China]AAU10946.1 hypothetical protein [lymphocystis disease virus-China]BCB67470.1 tumor necrosis factor receptor-like protein [Lymphocystis disease virus 2]